MCSKRPGSFLLPIDAPPLYFVVRDKYTGNAIGNAAVALANPSFPPKRPPTPSVDGDRVVFFDVPRNPPPQSPLLAAARYYAEAYRLSPTFQEVLKAREEHPLPPHSPPRQTKGGPYDGVLYEAATRLGWFDARRFKNWARASQKVDLPTITFPLRSEPNGRVFAVLPAGDFDIEISKFLSCFLLTQKGMASQLSTLLSLSLRSERIHLSSNLACLLSVTQFEE
jgi:hypothetical protein